MRREQGRGGKGKGKEGRRGGWERAPIGIFESRRLCYCVWRESDALKLCAVKFFAA